MIGAPSSGGEPGTVPWPRPVVVLTLLALMAASGLLCLAAINVGHDWGSDFALYISQAKSIVEGSTDRLLAQQVVTNRLSYRAPGPLLYPVGFPLLLAPLYALRGVDLVAFKTMGAALFVLALPLCFQLFRNRLGDSGAMLLVAILALSPEIPRFSDHILSDLPFFFFAMAALLSADRWHPRSPAFWHHVTIGALLAAAFLVRTVGIAVVAAVIVRHVVSDSTAIRAGVVPYVRSHWRTLVPYGVFVLLVLLAAWFYPATGYTVPGTGGYASAVIENARYYFSLPAAFFGNGVVFGAMVPFCAVGCLRDIRRDALYLTFCATSFAIYLVWPGQEGTRYILALIPFFVYFTFRGVRAVQHVVGTSMVRVAGAILLLVVAVKSVRVNAIDRRSHSSNQVATAQAREMFTFVSANSAPDDLVIFFKPRAMRLFTGRNAFRLRRTEDIVNSPAAYFVSDTAVVHDRLMPVFRNAGFVVYRVDRDR